MRGKFGCLFTILGLCLGQVAYSQNAANDRWQGIGFEATAKFATMIKHTAKFTGPMPAFCYGSDVNLLFQTYGRKPWHQIRNYPLVGIGLSYMNYNMPDIYGFAIGVNPNITLPIIRRNKWEWTVRAGMGVSFVSKYYNVTTGSNSQNVAIGGHFNNISPFAMDLRYKINRHWHLQAGLNFTHVSNASFQRPNLGINTYGYHIGARYFPVSSEPEKLSTNPAPSFRNNFMFTARTGIAFKENGPADGPTFRTYIVQAGIAKRYAGKNKVFTGIDLHYHTHLVYFAAHSATPIQHKMKTAGQYAWYLGHEFVFGRVGIIGQLGYYIRPYEFQSDKLYQKVGGCFYAIRNERGWVKELYFTALLKTHLSVAEIFEMGVGVSM